MNVGDYSSNLIGGDDARRIQIWLLSIQGGGVLINKRKGNASLDNIPNLTAPVDHERKGK